MTDPKQTNKAILIFFILVIGGFVSIYYPGKDLIKATNINPYSSVYTSSSLGNWQTRNPTQNEILGKQQIRKNMITVDILELVGVIGVTVGLTYVVSRKSVVKNIRRASD